MNLIFIKLHGSTRSNFYPIFHLFHRHLEVRRLVVRLQAILLGRYCSFLSAIPHNHFQHFLLHKICIVYNNLITKKVCIVTFSGEVEALLVVWFSSLSNQIEILQRIHSLFLHPISLKWSRGNFHRVVLRFILLASLKCQSSPVQSNFNRKQ